MKTGQLHPIFQERGPRCCSCSPALAAQRLLGACSRAARQHGRGGGHGACGSSSRGSGVTAATATSLTAPAPSVDYVARMRAARADPGGVCPLLMLAPMESLGDWRFRRAISQTAGGFDEACTGELTCRRGERGGMRFPLPQYSTRQGTVT